MLTTTLLRPSDREAVHHFAVTSPYEFFDASTAQQISSGNLQAICAWRNNRLVGLLTWVPAGIRRYALLVAIESRASGGGTQLLRELDRQLQASCTRRLKVTTLRSDCASQMRHLLANTLTLTPEIPT